MSDIYHVAIDGPSASGKGTAAANLSRELGIAPLDTGAVYRGMAVHAKNIGFPKLPDGWIESAKITAKIIDNATHIYLDGVDITGKLRENEISQIASKIATISEVRKYCINIFHEIAKKQSLICEGRDICSVVLPNAKFKFYLTASAKVRARRRYNELKARGQDVPFKQVLGEIKSRDKRDATQGGLVKTKDAIVIDSSRLDIDQMTQRMLNLILG